jgi:hypothetical protein
MSFNISYIFEAIDEFSGVANKITQKIAGLNQKFSSLSKNLTHAGGAMSLRVTAPLALIGTAALKSSDDLEEFRNKLDIVGASASVTQSMYKRLIDFTVSSPFNLKDVSASATTLLTMGNSIGQTMSQLKILGNITAATGGDMKMFAGMLGRAKSSSRGVSLLFTTLGQYGINVREELARMAAAAGHAGADINKAVLKGYVTFPIILQAIKNITTGNGQLAGQMNKLGGTLGALLGSAKTALQAYVLGPLGDLIVKTFNLEGLFKRMINYLMVNQNKIKLFIQTHKQLAKIVLVVGLLAAALGPVLIMMGVMSFLAGVISLPFVVISLIVLAIGAAIVWVLKQFFTWKQIGEGIMAVVKVIGFIFKVLAFVIKQIVNVIKVVFYIIKGIFYIIKEVGKFIIDSWLHPVKELEAVFKKIGSFFGHKKKLAIEHTHLMGQKAPIQSFSPVAASAAGSVKSHLAIALQDPGKLIKSIAGNNVDNMSLATGTNMRFSRI